MTSGWSAGAAALSTVQFRTASCGSASLTKSKYASTVPAKARAMPTDPSSTYFQEASTDALVTSRATSIADVIVVASIATHISPTLLVVTAQSIVKANRLAKIWKRRARRGSSLRLEARAEPRRQHRHHRHAGGQQRRQGVGAQEILPPGHHGLVGQDLTSQREGRSERDQGQGRVRPADGLPEGHRDQREQRRQQRRARAGIRRCAPPLSASAGSGARRPCSRTSRGSDRRRSA